MVQPSKKASPAGFPVVVFSGGTMMAEYAFASAAVCVKFMFVNFTFYPG